MAEEDRPPPPAPLRERPVVGCGAVVGVDDEPLDPDGEAVVHREGDERPAIDRQERLGTVVRQRAEAGPQPRPKDEGRPDHKLLHVSIIIFQVHPVDECERQSSPGGMRACRSRGAHC